ncbi:MAG: glycosyltransferase family 39 protein [Endomicrobiaceae bacterium]|nr:glycosyltransferase family 39 protein [Endomicrobiaceae bacterium]
MTYITKSMFFVFGKEYFDLIIIFINYIFFLIPLYFIYKISTELKDQETGNIAMILFALVPAIYGMSRQYGHKDYQLIAIITFNIYCLIKTDYFKDLKWSILYGISIGLGLLIKNAFIAYFFMPLVFIVLQSFNNNFEFKKTINISLSILIGILISSFHYFRLEIIKKMFYEPVTEPASLLSFESLRTMTFGLYDELLSLPIFIVFIIGIIWYIKKYKHKYKHIILLWFFIPWLTIILMPHHKQAEYGVGFIPAMILISALYISNIKKLIVKKIIVAGIVLICMVQYIDFSYQINTVFYRISTRIKGHEIRYYAKYGTNIMFYDSKKVKQIAEIVKYFKDNYPSSDTSTIFIDTNLEDVDSIHLIMELNDLHFNIVNDYTNCINVDNVNIIVYATNISLSDKINTYVHRLHERFYKNKNIDIKNFKRNETINLNNRRKYIDENFYTIKTLYFNDKSDMPYEINILVRKN